MNAQQAIGKLLDGKSLAGGEAELVMRAVMEGQATPAQIGALLVLLRQRGETVEEIAGFARVMREKALRVRASGPVVLDTCGTGGDGAGTFNISTLAALVAAAAGVRVSECASTCLPTASRTACGPPVSASSSRRCTTEP